MFTNEAIREMSKRHQWLLNIDTRFRKKTVIRFCANYAASKTLHEQNRAHWKSKKKNSTFTLKPRAYSDGKGVLGVDSEVFDVQFEQHTCHKKTCRAHTASECNTYGSSTHTWRHTHGTLDISRPKKTCGWYPGKIKIARMSEKDAKAIDFSRKDTTLVMDGNQIFLCVPYQEEALSCAQRDVPESAVAIDPGTRTFLTCYDTGSRCFELGTMKERAMRFCASALIICASHANMARRQPLFRRGTYVLFLTSHVQVPRGTQKQFPSTPGGSRTELLIFTGKRRTIFSGLTSTLFCRTTQAGASSFSEECLEMLKSTARH